MPGFALYKAKPSNILYTVAKMPALTTSQMAKIRQCLSSPHHNACITVECLLSIQVLGWMGWDGIFCGSGVARGYGQIYFNISIYFSKCWFILVYIEVHLKQKLFCEGSALDYVWPSVGIGGNARTPQKCFFQKM